MRRVAFAAASAAFLVSAGCGYIGPVVPPSPRIPRAITNLTAVERGDKVVITFSLPVQTTDSLSIEEYSEVDLRAGPAADPFHLEQWESTARTYPVTPHFTDEENPQPLPVTQTIPVSEWEGKKIDILVRTSGSKKTHFSDWSNRVTLDVIAPLQPPSVKVQATAAGYKLTWTADSRARQYRILRQGPGETTPSINGISDKPEYVDGTAQWDTPYSYSVIAQAGDVESLASAPLAVDSPDSFPPAVPTGLVALAGPNSVELSWSRNTELDLKGYMVFRSTDRGPFEHQGDLLTLPSFSDRSVEHGKRYRYSVSAVDRKGNPSDHSAPVEVAY